MVFIVAVKRESLIEKVVDFAGSALDVNEIFQSLYMSRRDRKKIDRRVEEIKSNRFYYNYLFDVNNIHPDDRERYIEILAYLAF
ncbi:hypothetical protein COU56_00360 [Candidatus Pacearchaeota archaeon CG10_big_fil_rev_8_21_14_0_10_31_9]|nr:MAG: hypothetical protein AUJ62_01295 [Candidatus Pacearchaeota archaeon CG1_02_32_21]PIN96171.1 MAG: hypothetical protein COU56_00360 [Candidatus Pacearchaeota archaeon CG10_big_fil_rev_8_21_14_0_10_31_9]PIZ83052.1 MAG: hypothetical protein COX97_01805 [Candidatus Pacearchaeota archaeon CG_4_10_14_0_2_um_filter_05_32_18]